MGFKSFEQWKAEKAGKVTSTAGVASAAPASGTPLDTGSAPRPRLTFQEWKAQKQKAPMVSNEVAQGVASAGPTQAQEPGLMDELGAAVKNYATHPIETATGAIAGLMAAPAAAAKQLLPGTDGFMDTVRGAQQIGKEDIAPFIKEEALPTAGALAATALAPELAIPVAAGKYGASLSVLAKSLYYGATGLAGATSGELAEQVAKKEGLLDAPDGAPETYGEAAKRAISRGAEEGAWTTAGALLFGMVPVAGRSAFTLFASHKETTKNMVEFLEKHDGPVLVSDVMDSLAISLADSAATNSYSKAGQTMRDTRAAQRNVVYREAKKPMEELAKIASTDDAIELYQDGILHSLPSAVLADHLRTALVDGEKVARSVIGVRYDAIDKLAEEMGTETITRMGAEIVKDPNTGKPIYDPIFGRIVTKPTMETIQVPKYTVDTTGAKDVIQKLIDERAGALQEDAAVDFTKFAREQVNLFKVNDKVTFKEARSIISDMDKEARRLARQDGDEFAATKRKFLLDSMAEFRSAMEVTGKQMAEDGHTIGGKTIDEYLKETNGMWKDISEDFGGKYVQSFIKKADKIEGAADTLAVAFLQNRESANGLMKALETSEKAASAPEMRLYTTGTAAEVIAAMPKTRAAISFKVYENLLQQYMNPGTRAKALAFMNNPESRGTVNQLLGNDLFNTTDTVMKVLHEMESAKIDVGEYTQFARESGAVLSAASGEMKWRTVSTLAAPGMLAKMLHSPDMIKVANGLKVADSLTQKAAIIAQLTKMGGEALIKDYENLTPEERELREYRLKLQQL